MGKKKRKKARVAGTQPEPAVQVQKPDWTKHLVKISIILLFLVYYGLHSSSRINLTTADLGRHIKNGELTLKQGIITTTNFYAYTEPDFPMINHHWGIGVIFYLLHEWVGFQGMSIVYLIILLSGFLIFFFSALGRSHFIYALSMAIFLTPILANRREIRPEGFSVFFLGLYFWLLQRYASGKISFKWLWVLPAVQLIWVNIHLFFPMGIFLIAVFFIDAWVHQRQQHMKELFIIGFVCGLVCLINPAGLKGVLVPFNIFKEYGYMLAENVSVPFMLKRFPDNFIYKHYIIMFSVAMVAMVWASIVDGFKKNIVGWILLLTFGLLAWKNNRSMPLFAFFSLVFTPQHISIIVQQVWSRHRLSILWVFVIGASVIYMLGMTQPKHYYSPVRKLIPVENKTFAGKGVDFLIKQPRLWTGLMPKVNASAKFFLSSGIEGPIFNNYDIGGYLIYNLYPKHRVYVDNRPEAYSVPFFKEEYIPMQEKEEVWEKFLDQYQFNAIYFYRHDFTPWAQPFLIRRLQDKEWAPVFVDGYTLILVRRVPKNDHIIKRHALPPEVFRYKGNAK